MKNYTYGWDIKNRGYVEIPKEEYSKHQLDMSKFIDCMSLAIIESKCGWDGVRFEAVKHNNRGDMAEYMVLYCDGGERWIPISGNSKGCNFSVLGENLW